MRWLKVAATLSPLAVLACLAYCVLDGGKPGPQLVPAPAGRPRPQGDLYVSAVPEPRSINPYATLDVVGRRLVLRYTHDTLLELAPEDARLRPALAEVLGSSADGLEHELRLRDDLRFADGSPLTLEDVAFTLETVQNPGVAMSDLRDVLENVRECVAIDARRFRIRCKQALFSGLAEIGCTWRVASKRHFLAEVARRARAAGEMPPAPQSPEFGRWLSRIDEPGPGSGPYQLRSGDWRRGRELTLVRNPHSWRYAAQPECWNLDGHRLRFLGDNAPVLHELRFARVDWYAQSDGKQLLAEHAELAREYRLCVYDKLSDGHLMLAWNCRRPELAAPATRRALTMLCDREFLAREILGGQARVAAGWFRPGTSAYPADLAPHPFAPEQARQLLDGVTPRLARLEVLFDPMLPIARQMLESSVAHFARAGVALVPQPLESKALQERLAGGEFAGAFLVVQHAAWIDPGSWFLSSAGAEQGRNVMGYANAEVDRVLTAARFEPDAARRDALWLRFQQLLHADQPVSLLAHPRSSVLLHRRFEAADPGLLGLVPERWWVAPERRRY